MFTVSQIKKLIYNSIFLLQNRKLNAKDEHAIAVYKFEHFFRFIKMERYIHTFSFYYHNSFYNFLIFIPIKHFNISYQPTAESEQAETFLTGH